MYADNRIISHLTQWWYIHTCVCGTYLLRIQYVKNNYSKEGIYEYNAFLNTLHLSIFQLMLI